MKKKVTAHDAALYAYRLARLKEYSKQIYRLHNDIAKLGLPVLEDVNYKLDELKEAYEKAIFTYNVKNEGARILLLKSVCEEGNEKHE